MGCGCVWGGGPNYSALDYVQRTQLLDSEKGDIEGILIERTEVGIADRCVQTLLEIQTLTNITQQSAEGQILCHPTCPTGGKADSQDTFGQMRYGRLILNTEIYPFVKRVSVILGAIRKSRIGQFQTKGAERKKHMKVYNEETAAGKAHLIYGRLGRMIDEASKMSGLTQKQYRDWGKIECMDTNARNSRGRILSKRRKDKKNATERVDRETSASRRDRQ